MTSTLTPLSIRSRIRGVCSVAALVAWTLFVWVGRIRNIAADEVLSGWDRVVRLSMAWSFVGLAVVVTVMAVRQLRSPERRRANDPWLPGLDRSATILAVYGIVVWAFRGIDIALGAYNFAFIAVHVALAVVTITLGVWVLRTARSNRLTEG